MARYEWQLEMSCDTATDRNANSGPVSTQAPTAHADLNRQDLATEDASEVSKLGDVATAILHARRRRTQLFGRHLFVEPAWDMLLKLFVAHVRRAHVHSTSLCAAAEVPVPTGLRWIEKLEARGLVSRASTPKDGRITLVALTDDGFRLMREYITEGLFRSEMPVKRSPGRKRDAPPINSAINQPMV